MKTTKNIKKLNELKETFGHKPLHTENTAVLALVKNVSWRPDITDPNKRFIAAAIQLSVNGKASKKMCINNFLRRGFVPLFQGCRNKVSAMGLIPREYTEAEQIYYDALNAQDKEEKQRAAAEEVNEEIALEQAMKS